MHIPHVRVSIGDEDIAAVTEVLRSGQLAMGPAAAALERALRERTGQGHAIAVNSGTAALHAALMSLGIGRGDEVIIPAYACQALVNAIKYVDAEVRLVDIDLETFNIDVAAAKASVTSRTKAVMVPHMFGLMCDMEALASIGVPVIEDCAMGIGAMLGTRPAGSFGDIATFSFYATKLVTGGEGGAIVTSDEEYAIIAQDIREYDKKRDFRVRYNYKMSDLNAALALSQLQRLDAFIEQRRAVARRYEIGLNNTAFKLPAAPEGYGHAFARYVIRADDGNRVRAHLRERGIGAGKGVVFGIHELVSDGSEYLDSDEALRTAVSLPIYPTLSEREQDTVIQALCEY